MYSATGLLGFLIYSCVADEWRGWIATVVVSNGLAYHGATHWNAKPRDALFWWDVGCNAVLCTLINVASTVQPWTGAGTALAAAAWPFGWLVGPTWGHAVHVLGVQGVLLWCLATAW